VSGETFHYSPDTVLFVRVIIPQLCRRFGQQNPGISGVDHPHHPADLLIIDRWLSMKSILPLVILEGIMTEGVFSLRRYPWRLDCYHIID
jgi:hypothetical protein